MSNTDGTIDITNLVEASREAFVTWGSNFLVGAIAGASGAAWLVTWPVVGTLVKKGIEWCLDALSKSGVMDAFFVNTAIRKASQSKDFTDAVADLKALPPTASEEEYEKLEQKKMLAFSNFVRVSN